MIIIPDDHEPPVNAGRGNEPRSDTPQDGGDDPAACPATAAGGPSQPPGASMTLENQPALYAADNSRASGPALA